mmetsp:Transcript_88492/g.283937  ORF Transcript_88492/g.283937 Transcript_88492/m.283937 type:complete len:330 (+) Transcript_88492:129-1118(+)
MPAAIWHNRHCTSGNSQKRSNNGPAAKAQAACKLAVPSAAFPEPMPSTSTLMSATSAAPTAPLLQPFLDAKALATVASWAAAGQPKGKLAKSSSKARPAGQSTESPTPCMPGVPDAEEPPAADASAEAAAACSPTAKSKKSCRARAGPPSTPANRKKEAAHSHCCDDFLNSMLDRMRSACINISRSLMSAACFTTASTHASCSLSFLARSVSNSPLEEMWNCLLSSPVAAQTLSQSQSATEAMPPPTLPLSEEGGSEYQKCSSSRTTVQACQVSPSASSSSSEPFRNCPDNEAAALAAAAAASDGREGEEEPRPAMTTAMAAERGPALG